MIQQYYSIRKDTNKYTETDLMNEIKEDIAILVEQGFTELSNIIFTCGFNNNTTRFGFCRRSKTYATRKAYISISSIAIKTCSPSKVHNTIMHEVCHAVNGGHTHSHGWLKAITIINNLSKKGIYEFTELSRVGEDEGFTEYKKSISKYIIKCEKCGHEYSYQRRSKVVESVASHKGECYCKCGSYKLILITH